jgi:site-specific DNA recombinase
MQLMDAARERKFDIILVEALDRLSRDQEDLAGIWKRLIFLGVELRAVHEGTADQIQIGVRGFGSLFLTDLAHKVRRGMQGVVRDGRNAGGRAYGYRPVVGKPGELEIIEEEATIIRRIFHAYVSGLTPREIAYALNNDGIRPPRGANWTSSTINGNKKRHHGIILNEVYAGIVVWNRMRMMKDPDTGRRISRPNPPEEWKRAEAGLAIIDKALFNEAAQRFSPPRSLRSEGSDALCDLGGRSFPADPRSRSARFWRQFRGGDRGDSPRHLRSAGRR